METPRLFRPFSRTLAAAVLALSTFVSPQAQAVPAYSDARILSQPDGTTFAARLWGDEWSNGWETAEGYTILKDEVTRRWSYAVADVDGRLRASAQIVGKNSPPAGVMRSLRPSDEGTRKRTKALRSEQAEKAAPSKGVNNVLTILVNYSDTRTTNTPEEFTTHLYGRGNFSMVDFYTEVSYGQFTVSPGPAGIRGWYTLPITRAQAASRWTEPVYLGVEAADRDGVDFAPYDQDGDCFVDAVSVVHQGPGQELTGDSLDVWSHRWTLAAAFLANQGGRGVYVTRTPCAAGGFIKVNDYIIQPERTLNSIATVGVFVHEYGHILGLPDLYDTDGTSVGAGIWSVMAAGSWGKDSVPGDRPTHYDPWSKYRLGWLKPVKIGVSAVSTRVLRPANARADAWQFGDGDAVARKGEYFLVENRQKAGFDAGLPAGGMVVWHIDEAVGSEWLNDANSYECAPVRPGACRLRHYRVAVVQADGQWELENRRDVGDSADVFPGATGNTSFTDDTTPDARFYSGARSNIRINGIRLDGENVVANVSTTGGRPDPLRMLRFAMAGSGKVSMSYSGTSLECSGSCSNGVPDGTVITMTASPAPNFVFRGWSAGRLCSGTGPCTLTMSRNVAVRARFVPKPKFALTYAKAGNGGGTVSISPVGIGGAPLCAGRCRNIYYSGTVVTVTAAPAPGSTFTGWSGTAGCTGVGTCTITMDRAKRLVANFQKATAVSSCIEPACLGPPEPASAP